MTAALRAIRVASPPPLDDGELIDLVREGNLRGLGELFDRHGDLVHRLLLRLDVDARDVDDLVQETFLDAIDAARGFEAGRSVRSWLCGLAMVVARRHRRSVARMMRKVALWASKSVEPPVATPADALEWSEEAARGQRALMELPPRMREAFVLVVVEQLSGAEAAAALDIPIATVWTRVHYARREMARLLELDPS